MAHTTPSAVVAHVSTGTRRERVAAKRAAIRAWLATPEGAAYLAALPADRAAWRDPHDQMVAEEAGLRDPHEQRPGRIRSASGTWAAVYGARAVPLTAAECAAAGLPPGPGNT